MLRQRRRQRPTSRADRTSAQLRQVLDRARGAWTYTANSAHNEFVAGTTYTDTFVHAATDITGFGLIGHVREMAAGSGVSVRIDSAKVPLLEGALDCVRSGFIPGGLKNNREFAECMVGYEANVPEEIRTILVRSPDRRRPAAIRRPLRCRVAPDRVEQCRRTRGGDWGSAAAREAADTVVWRMADKAR